MTDPIGSAHERELIAAIVTEANSWSMTKPNRAHKLRAAADALQSRIAEVERLTERARWRDAKSEPPQKTDELIAQPFLAWCPDDDAPNGGDQRIVWWEPRMNGGCWFGDRDLVESFTHWKPLDDAPRAALSQHRKL